MERSWGAIFSPYPQSCTYSWSFVASTRPLQEHRPKVHLVSYADGKPVYFANQADLVASAADRGFDTITSYKRQDLDSDFVAKNHDILSRNRGAGYWLWKPYIILKALMAAAPGDIVMYLDCGVRIRNHLGPLIQLAHQHDLLLFANFHTNREYTKRECLDIMGFRGDDLQFARESLQMDAAFMFTKNTTASVEFVRQWLVACQNARAITDDKCQDPGLLPEFADLIDHRHDQAILSLLTLMSIGQKTPMYIYPTDQGVYFDHHRRLQL
jgi:hypothetical protein